MSSRTPGSDGRYIVVADEDKAVVGFVIETLLNLKQCDLVISNTRVGGAPEST